MYTILVTSDNELMATQKSAIIQNSKLVDELHFLVPVYYGKEDMRAYTTVTLEYLSPISKTYKPEFLVLSDELYKDHLEYCLPIDTNFTKEAGDIEVQLTFTKVELDADTGVPIEHVRKTKSCKIPIFPIANWSQFITDEALTTLDQKVSKLTAVQNEITEVHTQIMETINKDNN